MVQISLNCILLLGDLCVSSPDESGRAVNISSRQDLISKRRDREISPHSRRAPRLGEEDHIIRSDAELGLQCIHQLRQAMDLLRSRHVGVVVADQADADAVGVDLGDAGRRRGGLLIEPARADLDFAVLAALAVADDEMIGQTHRAAMGQRRGTAADGLAVVDEDVSPVVGLGGCHVDNLVQECRAIQRGQRVVTLARQWRRRQREQQCSRE